MRLAFFISRQSFIYLWVGTVNLGFGLSSIYLYFFGNANFGLPQTLSINLTCGLILLIDGLILRRKPHERAPLG
jgi:hypothetical protein